MTHKLFPCLWFNGQAKAAADYYFTVFKNSKMVSENPMVVIFELNETKFMALNGGPQYKFSPANSYVITCDTQEEKRAFSWGTNRRANWGWSMGYLFWLL